MLEASITSELCCILCGWINREMLAWNQHIAWLQKDRDHRTTGPKKGWVPKEGYGSNIKFCVICSTPWLNSTLDRTNLAKWAYLQHLIRMGLDMPFRDWENRCIFSTLPYCCAHVSYAYLPCLNVPLQKQVQKTSRCVNANVKTGKVWIGWKCLDIG